MSNNVKKVSEPEPTVYMRLFILGEMMLGEGMCVFRVVVVVKVGGGGDREKCRREWAWGNGEFPAKITL